ncbi:MAG: prepilin-type N-terminal cleavage/methylation domain-containing protein [Planctomycetaceae bacterium]|nr:prepilin-type N-terminal cleavage/methylation domain-containing protein [Planctomycetaceae bacterium]
MTLRAPRNLERTNHRAGFSLIEVLIALGLSVLLISAIYAAIDLHFRIQSVGRAEIAGQQLLRSLIRRMSEDVGSIVMYLPEKTTEEEAAATDDSSSASSSTGDSALTLGGLEEGENPLNFGLTGTADAMHITVSKPSRDLAYSSLFFEGTGGRASDTVIISYGLASTGNERFSILETPTGHPGMGFGRRVMDLFAAETIPNELDSVHVIAPEIVSVSFRYFDGAAWYESWDSLTNGMLPTAVEVTFGFWNDPPPKSSASYEPGQRGTISPYAHRFYVPLSVPFTDTEI